LQLKAYYDNTDALPNVQQPIRKAKKTASDILYPKNKQQTTQAPTLELEVEQYLAAMNENIGIVDFWQASD